MGRSFCAFLLLLVVPWVVSRSGVMPVSFMEDAIARYEEKRELLSVDDDPVNQMVISSLFESEGFTVHQAMDGFEALEFMAENPCPDLILLDVMMPGMSGYEVLDTLRAEYPADLPIVMISAKAASSEKVEGIEHLANDYQTKPFQKEELLARVRTLIVMRHCVNMFNEANAKQAGLEQLCPPHILARVVSGEANIHEKYDRLCVMRAQIDRFGQVSEALPLPQLVTLLNKVQTVVTGIARKEAKFSGVHLEFDGSSLAAFAGHGPEHATSDGAERLMLEFGQRVLQETAQISVVGMPLSKLLRLAIDVGESVGGLVGDRFTFMGGAVVSSARLVSAGEPGYIHVSERVLGAASVSAIPDDGAAFFFGERGELQEGDAKIRTFLLKNSADEDLSEFKML